MKDSGITDLMHRVVVASTSRPAPAAAITRPAPAAEITRPAPAAEITLPGTAASVPVARRFVRDALPGCPRADDLVLAVSELASNGITHSASRHGGTITVRVRTAARWARTEVADDGPAAGPAGHGNGWGLGIVAAVTERAGATIHPDGTRTAWAEITWPP